MSGTAQAQERREGDARLAEIPADLRVTDVQSLTFTYRSRVGRDVEGHAHPAAEHEKRQRLTRVRTSAGVDGYCFGGSEETTASARRIIVGRNPLDREAIAAQLQHGQRLEWRALAGRMISVLDQALWDIAGQLAGLPVYRLLGGFRDKVPAYASTMCGDDIPGGLAYCAGTPNRARRPAHEGA